MKSDSPEFLQLCLARYVCNLAGKDTRVTFLQNWRKNHGDTSADKLERLVKAEWDKRKQQ